MPVADPNRRRRLPQARGTSTSGAATMRHQIDLDEHAELVRERLPPRARMEELERRVQPCGREYAPLAVVDARRILGEVALERLDEHHLARGELR
ncbi:hypothetical protein OV079_49570 [Nannocystis pusilla]|uniref:Uncharacterized protein n=1 Tax=Nannocystis pusilla TaxID=889268 RepID=A0A9X3EZZ6_9BACT|nr:hypothetical protein [Nannocystis pusilla]MCY1013448.1 hypothetical protein [Nannocystis pusilla]